MTEPTQATLGGPGTAGHPDLEDLAALADGNCGSTDAARLRAHLASCEECYEVFVDTLQLREELGGEEDDEEEEVAQPDRQGRPAGPDLASPLPYPRRIQDEEKDAGVPSWVPEEARRAGGKPGRVFLFPFDENLRPHYWMAAAALLIALLGVGLYKWYRQPSFSVAGLAAQTGKIKELDRLAWGERTRGIGTSPEDPSFRLGVELLNLQVALESGDRSSADAAAAAINGLLGSLSFLDKASRDYYVNLRSQLVSQQPETLSGAAAKEAETLRNAESVGKVDLELGTWAEAGRLAAYSRNPAAFQKKSADHFLSELQKEEPPATVEGKEASQTVSKALKTIDDRLSAPNLQPRDYEDLKSAFDQILRAYYPQGERGGL